MAGLTKGKSDDGTKTQKEQKIRISLLVSRIIDRIDPDRIASVLLVVYLQQPVTLENLSRCTYKTHHAVDRYYLPIWRFDLGHAWVIRKTGQRMPVAMRISLL